MDLANTDCSVCGEKSIVHTTTAGRLECTMCGAMIIYTPRISNYPKINEPEQLSLFDYYARELNR